jgi:hypothetical protein
VRADHKERITPNEAMQHPYFAPVRRDEEAPGGLEGLLHDSSVAPSHGPCVAPIYMFMYRDALGTRWGTGPRCNTVASTQYAGNMRDPCVSAPFARRVDSIRREHARPVRLGALHPSRRLKYVGNMRDPCVSAPFTRRVDSNT